MKILIEDNSQNKHDPLNKQSHFLNVLTPCTYLFVKVFNCCFDNDDVVKIKVVALVERFHEILSVSAVENPVNSGSKDFNWVTVKLLSARFSHVINEPIGINVFAFGLRHLNNLIIKRFLNFQNWFILHLNVLDLHIDQVALKISVL